MKLNYEGEKAFRYGRIGINVSHEDYLPEYERFGMKPNDDLIIVSMVVPLGYNLLHEDKDKLLKEFGMDISKPVHSYQELGALTGMPMKFFVQVNKDARKEQLN